MGSSAADAFPDGVPLVIPDGWKRATLGAPVPVVRCTYIFPDTHARPGEQCKRWSLRGALKCVKHGGQLANVRQHAEAMVESARLRLVGDTDHALDVLEDLMDNSSSDAVRLKAVTEVLDRAGVRGGIEVDVSVESKQDPAEVLRNRINVLRQRTIEAEVIRREEDQLAVEAATAGDEAEVPGTVLEDTPAPPTEETPDAD